MIEPRYRSELGENGPYLALLSNHNARVFPSAESASSTASSPGPKPRQGEKVFSVEHRERNPEE